MNCGVKEAKMAGDGGMDGIDLYADVDDFGPVNPTSSIFLYLFGIVERLLAEVLDRWMMVVYVVKCYKAAARHGDGIKNATKCPDGWQEPLKFRMFQIEK